jgi:SHS2 domain-containing protein
MRNAGPSRDGFNTAIGAVTWAPITQPGWFLLMKPFHLVNHTADIGLVFYGEDLETLFEHAAKGFFHILTDLRRVRTRIEKRVEIPPKPYEFLLVEWLGELLYLHDVEHLLFREFRVESIGEMGLKAIARGEPYREGVHLIKTGVKAVTYHQIEVKQGPGGWRGRVIFDL